MADTVMESLGTSWVNILFFIAMMRHCMFNVRTTEEMFQKMLGVAVRMRHQTQALKYLHEVVSTPTPPDDVTELTDIYENNPDAKQEALGFDENSTLNCVKCSSCPSDYL